MKLKYIMVLNLILGSLTVGSIAQAQGSGSVGGGTVVIRSPGEAPVLLDFLDQFPNLSETHQFSNNSPLVISKTTEYLGSDSLIRKEIPAWAELEKRLDAWFDFAPGLVTMIRYGEYSTGHRVTDLGLKLIPEFVLSNNLKRQFPALTLKTAAIFSKISDRPVQISSTLISIPVWNSLGDQSQMGLLIHEAFRYLQNEKGFAISNAEIQTLTTKMIFSAPSKDAHLEEVFTGLFKAELEKIDASGKWLKTSNSTDAELKAIKNHTYILDDMIGKFGSPESIKDQNQLKWWNQMISGQEWEIPSSERAQIRLEVDGMKKYFDDFRKRGVLVDNNLQVVKTIPDPSVASKCVDFSGNYSLKSKDSSPDAGVLDGVSIVILQKGCEAIDFTIAGSITQHWRLDGKSYLVQTNTDSTVLATYSSIDDDKNTIVGIGTISTLQPNGNKSILIFNMNMSKDDKGNVNLSTEYSDDGGNVLSSQNEYLEIK